MIIIIREKREMAGGRECIKGRKKKVRKKKCVCEGEKRRKKHKQ
jgi:hypothetical protein